jgi:uncharacterized membrane protein affecting hemolysin expression
MEWKKIIMFLHPILYFLAILVTILMLMSIFSTGSDLEKIVNAKKQLTG